MEISEAIKPRILLVEDEPVIIKINSIYLQNFGYSFDVAQTGSDALKLAVKNKYDAILMDIGLPDIDGIALANHIRQSQEINYQTPIIALTGYAREEVEPRCLAAGMNEVACKPVDQGHLGKILHHYCKRN